MSLVENNSIKINLGDSILVGPEGPQGIQGIQGPEGKSAYEVAIENGYEGTEDDWLASLKAAIDDSKTATDTTWSSTKIDANIRKNLDGNLLDYTGTFEQLQSDYSIDITKIYRINNTSDTTYNNHFAYYNGTSWIDGGVYQDIFIKDDSIRKSKTTFYYLNKYNLYNKENITKNCYVNHNTGLIESSTIEGDYYATDFIEVEPNSAYIYSDVEKQHQYAWYDEQRSYISGGMIYNDLKKTPIKSPENSKYIRITVREDFNTFVFCKGGVPYDYTDGLQNIDENYLNKKYINYLRTENQLDRNNMLLGFYDNNGSIETQTVANRYLSNFIELNFGEKLQCSQNYIRVTEYDNSYNFLYNTNSVVASPYSPTKQTCKYVRVLLDIPEGTNVMINRGDELLPYVPYLLPNIKENTINFNMLDENLQKQIENSQSNTSIIYGKKCVFFGDSITQGYNPVNHSEKPFVDSPYPLTIQEKYGCNSINLGVSGSTITAGDEQSFRPFVERLSDIPNDADYLFIMGGTNDYLRSLPIGSESDSTNNTLYGALNNIFDYIYTNFPDCKIGFGIPFPTNSNLNFESYYNCIKTACENNSIPIIDFYLHGEAKPKNTTWKDNNMPDGIHPIQKFYDRIANRIAYFLFGL